MKKKQHTIADVLHRAADLHLIAHERYEGGYRERFSCCAIQEAIYRMYGSLYGTESSAMYRRIKDGLTNMGCDVGSSYLFKKYGDKPDRYEDINHTVQGMRYMWLKWAALMAEEQGV